MGFRMKNAKQRRIKWENRRAFCILHTVEHCLCRHINIFSLFPFSVSLNDKVSRSHRNIQIDKHRIGFGIFVSLYVCLCHFSLVQNQQPTVITVQLFYILHWFKCIHTNAAIKMFTFFNRFHQKKIHEKIIFLLSQMVSVSVLPWHSNLAVCLFFFFWFIIMKQIWTQHYFDIFSAWHCIDTLIWCFAVR